MFNVDCPFLIIIPKYIPGRNKNVELCIFNLIEDEFESTIVISHKPVLFLF